MARWMNFRRSSITGEVNVLSAVLYTDLAMSVPQHRT